MKSSVKDFVLRGVSLSGVVALACVAFGVRGVESHATKPAGFSSFAGEPLCFEANSGPSADSAGFIARGAACSVLLSPAGAEIVLGKSSEGIALHRELATRSVRLRLIGANPEAKIAGRDQLAATANYFIGNDSSQWRAGVPLFSRVQVNEVYSGMQMIYYANQSAQLEYDFQLQPGAWPEQIRFQIEGADAVRVDAAGNLVLQIGDEEISQHRPVAYQMSKGARKEVQAAYHLNADGTVGFMLGAYDRNSPLVIDPVLDFLTYLGGKKQEFGWAIAIDSSENVYVAGETLSVGLLTTNAINYTNAANVQTNLSQFQGGTRDFGDAFVASYDLNGALRYLTYLGGKKNDGALAIAADGGGGVWLTGFSDSTNFPLTANAIRTQLTGKHNNSQNLFQADAIVCHLDPTGSNLDYSTYFGGDGLDEGVGIAVVNSNQVYLTGFTTSTNLPVTPPNAYQTKIAGNTDVFITKLIDGAIVYTTYLGGTNTDYGLSVAPDSAGDAWVTGFTYSTNFPTTNWLQLSNVFQTQMGGTTESNHLFADLNSQTNSAKHNTSFRSDGFVSEISPAGTALLFSAYLGGTNDDSGVQIKVASPNDDVYITGYTFSRDYPTNVLTLATNASDIVFTNLSTNFISHVFVTEITNASPNSAIAFSTAFGGIGDDQGTGIAVDDNGLIYVTGSAGSTNFFQTNMLVFTNSLIVTNKHGGTNTVYLGTMTNSPNFTNLSSTNNAIKLRHKGNTNDMFVAVLAPGGSNFVQSILLGGPGDDEARGIAVTPSGSAVYVVGYTTSSTNFVTTNNAAQLLFGGAKNSKLTDAFVGKIVLGP